MIGSSSHAPAMRSEVEQRLRAVEHAVAQQALEGLTVSEATINDMRRACLGDIPDEEVIANIYARFSADSMAKS